MDDGTNTESFSGPLTAADLRALDASRTCM